MSNSGKGSKRRPTDQQKFEDNFDKIFRMQQQEEWREEIINERQKESLTDNVKRKPLKDKNGN
tara:strand:- start:1641 stop:1829 length:189 start_codon:yes stop_codon:yes gene_type:complete